MIITDNDDGEIEKFRVKLFIWFEMNDLGEHHFLGLEVENVKDSIHVSQEGYAKKIIERFDLKDARGDLSHLMLI